MTVSVQFPDGTTRDVPSVSREIRSQQIGGGQSIFIEEPADDPDWRFRSAIGGKWFATPRR